jgi:gamma-glutamyltranspeptidase/glutathione hydrolase
MAAEGRTYGLDFNARAPRAAHAGMYEVLGPAAAGGINVLRVKDDANVDGPLAVTVPTTCAGFCAAHARFGQLALAQVLEPAIGLAADGFESNWHTTLYLANQFAALSADPYLAAMWLPNGRPPRSSPKPGERIRQPELADLLRRVARDGAAGMYAGEVADAIDSWMRAHGGLLTRQDLADYQPTFAEPLRQQFRDATLACVSTPSGAITSLEIFGILNQLPLDAPHNSAPYLHTLIEAARHAFADRYRYLGDWEQAPVPLDALHAPAYAAELARLIRPDATTTQIAGRDEPWGYYLERALHDPWGFSATPRPADAPAFAVAAPEGPETTHINVVDRERNAVSCTHTGAFSSVHPEGTGVYLTGGMAWFTPLAGHPNAIAPWKRPMGNMCPVMIFRDGRPVICQGAPGARRIIHRGVQVLLNILVHDLGPQDAVAALTVDASGRDVLADARLPAATLAQLRELGHSIVTVEEEPGGTGNFSRPSAVVIDYDQGVVRAGVDVFRPALALGY